MEKKLGSVFKYDGIRLRVDESPNGCQGCYFLSKDDHCQRDIKRVGYCCAAARDDLKYVIFRKV